MAIDYKEEFEKASGAVEELTKRLSAKETELVELRHHNKFLQEIIDKTVAENNLLKNAIISKFLGIKLNGTEITNV